MPIRSMFLPLFVLLLSGGFVRLGVWQLDRADEDTSLAAMIKHRTGLPALEFAHGDHVSQQMLFRRVMLHGRFDPDRRLLLDDRTQNGALGYHVIVPFHIDGSDLSVLVNRGWVPRNAPTQTFPQRTEVSGLMVRPAVPVLRLQSSAQNGKPHWPSIQPYVAPAEFAERYGHPMLPFLLVEDPRLAADAVTAGLARADRRGMHIGYSIQWFVFAGLAVVLFIAMVSRRWRAPR